VAPGLDAASVGHSGQAGCHTRAGPAARQAPD
jgi:hypothetical protein